MGDPHPPAVSHGLQQRDLEQVPPPPPSLPRPHLAIPPIRDPHDFQTRFANPLFGLDRRWSAPPRPPSSAAQHPRLLTLSPSSPLPHPPLPPPPSSVASHLSPSLALVLLSSPSLPPPQHLSRRRPLVSRLSRAPRRLLWPRQRRRRTRTLRVTTLNPKP